MARGDTRPGKNGGTLISGGPGRPKGSVNVTNELKKLLEEERAAGKSNLRAVAEKWLDSVLADGNPQNLKQILDRVDGPVTQKLELSSLTREELLAKAKEAGLDKVLASNGADESEDEA